MQRVFASVNRISERWAVWPVFASMLLCAASAHAEKIRNHFDSDSVMRGPGFFDPVILGAPGPARWLVLTDLNPPSAPNRLVQVEKSRPADSIAAVLRRNSAFQDGTVSTFVKQGSGREGLILRMRDEKNFLILLVEASGEVVLSAYSKGGSKELGRGRVAFARPWEKFSLTASGQALSVFFNDERRRTHRPS